MSRFYITTPLYYVNDKPHLGTVYSTVIADTLKRYHKLFEYETFLLTGTDEHGQKCFQSAKQHNIPTQIYCDKMAKQFENTWKLLDISYDRFFRTTQAQHKQAVQNCLQKLYDQQLVYPSTYEGWYCVSEESFYTSKDLVNGLSPGGKKVNRIKETNYFFKMSAYQEALKNHIVKNPNFIQPEHRRNEILSFLKQPLSDLCVTRPKSRVSWGVEVPFDPQFVAYVWVDALLNYITGIGYLGPNFDRKTNGENLPLETKKWWVQTGAIHIIGKDILMTHCVYWPCLLMALELPLPKTILAHGWLLNPDQEKMSKSQGDVMDPTDLLKTFSADQIRYCLIRDVPIGNDASISMPLLIRRVNEDLANNLGNLLRRTVTMIHKHFSSVTPEPVVTLGNLEKKLKLLGSQTAESVKADVLKLRPGHGVNSIVRLLNETNKYLEQKAPWKLIKEDKKHTQDVLRSALEIIYLCAVLLKPVMPKTMATLLDSLSCPDQWPVEHFKSGAFPKAGSTIKDIPPLFPRIKVF